MTNMDKYTKHAELAAGYAAQQMKDRDDGYFNFAKNAQSLAAHHAQLARTYRKLAAAAMR